MNSLETTQNVPDPSFTFDDLYSKSINENNLNQDLIQVTGKNNWGQSLAKNGEQDDIISENSDDDPDYTNDYL